MTKKQQITKHLKKGKHTTRVLAALTDSSLSYVGAVLAEIRRGGKLKHERQDGGYPLRYYLEAK